MRRDFCDLHAELLHALECTARPGICNAVTARRDVDANLNESVGWFMRTLEVLAMCDTCIDALRRVAKIQCVVTFRVLDDAIYTEQPNSSDAAAALITPGVSNIHISFGV
jgi:hypothetical protein